MAGGGGGAWKVAYADFVTAMMALFMVLWISAQDEEILIATSQYFQSPFNSPMDASSGVMSDGGGSSSDSSISEMEPTSVSETAMLNQLAQEFYKHLDIDDQQDRPAVEVQVTNDGLRVRVYDRTDRPVFDANTARFTEWGDFVIQNLAWLIGRNEFRIRIDGHTASNREMPDENYTEWELSSDRANATRRALHYYAIPNERFDQVSGYADTYPVEGFDPGDNENERMEISLVLIRALPVYR